MASPDIGPPFPGETLIIYDNSKAYWNIVPDSLPGHIVFTAVNGTAVKINRQTGAIEP